MGRNRNQRMFKRAEMLELDIQEMAFGGKGVARIKTEQGDFVVFVPNTLPGQKIKARITKCKKSYAEAKLEKVVTRSPEEVEIPYQEISGAPYAKWPIPYQEKHKKESSLDLFRKFGDLSNPEDIFDTYISSPLEWHYRNKMEYSFSAIGFDTEKETDVDEFSLGFKKRGTWWMVENLDKDSGLFDAQVESGLSKIREYLKATDLPAWHPPRKDGFYRFLVVRKSYHTDSLLFNLVTTSERIDKFDKEGFVNLLTEMFGDRVKGIMHTMNDDIGDRTHSTEGFMTLLYGEDKIVERVCGLDFQMSLQSFFQTNPVCAEKLYNKALDYVFEDNNDLNGQVVLDLFCGTGTIAQCMASRSPEAKVIGVEIVKEAVKDAKKNTEANKLKNVSYFAEDVGKFLTKYPNYKGKIASLVLDPPRAGIAPKTLKKVIDLGANRIVYISCNPATQARDMKLLQEAGYKPVRFSLADQFPHTAHVESVFRFDKV
jgi:23S rRNA (uracil-5-)-methyltransferase RumA